VLDAVRRETLSGAELAGVVDLWLGCADRSQQQYILAHPREALSQAKGLSHVGRDPRLSEAGNHVWKRATYQNLGGCVCAPLHLQRARPGRTRHFLIDSPHPQQA
jgi:hypothetical protein